jgi:hypothetical protein
MGRAHSLKKPFQKESLDVRLEGKGNTCYEDVLRANKLHFMFFFSYGQKLSPLSVAAVVVCCGRKFICEHMLAWPWCDALFMGWRFWSSVEQRHFAWDDSHLPTMQSFNNVALMVVSHERSTAWDPSESNLSLLRLSHLAYPATAYGFNLVP